MRYIKFPPRRQSRFFKKYQPVFWLTALVVFISVAVAFFSGSNTVFKFIFPSLTSLKSTDDRVNVLLLGNPGSQFNGPYLTDTIIVASLNLKTNQAYLISLPRDLWLNDYKIKLNAAYEVGRSKNNGGLSFSKKIAEDILGIPIHYGVRVDFSGFIKAVDDIEGLNVNVERSFDDYYYPVAGKEDDLCDWEEKEIDFDETQAQKYNVPIGKLKVLIDKDGQIATDSAEPDRGLELFKCRYEHISFPQGQQHMSGELALKFVRSRMGTGGEGSDFARSKRQQKVIDSVRKKVLTLETLLNPQKITSLVDTFGESFEADLPVSQFLEAYRLTKRLENTLSFVIDSNGPSPLLVNPPRVDFGGAWVLLPKGGSFNEVHQFVKKILAGEIKENEASSSSRTSN